MKELIKIAFTSMAFGNMGLNAGDYPNPAKGPMSEKIPNPTTDQGFTGTGNMLESLQDQYKDNSLYKDMESMIGQTGMSWNPNSHSWKSPDSLSGKSSKQ